MGENILKGKNLKPIICTLAEAQRILGPVTMGYAWGEGTIADLWRRCAPVPGGLVGTPAEKRIISPAHLGEWLADVLDRQGRPVNDAGKIYLEFHGAKVRGNGSRAAAGPGA